MTGMDGSSIDPSRFVTRPFVFKADAALPAASACSPDRASQLAPNLSPNQENLSRTRPMLRNLSRMILLLVGLAMTSASAGDPSTNCLFKIPNRVDCIGSWCCDDYCSKKEPCVCAPLCFTCDDYRKKCEPYTNACLGSCCDDYCKKCPPQVCTRPACAANGSMYRNTTCDGCAMTETLRTKLTANAKSTRVAAVASENLRPAPNSSTNGSGSSSAAQPQTTADVLLPVRVECLPSSRTGIRL